MNILFVTRGFYPAFEFGGPIPVARYLTKGLAQRGHQVTVYTSNLLNDREKLSQCTVEREVDGVHVVYFNSLWQYNWMAITPDVVGYCRHRLQQFDVINIYGYRELMTFLVARYAVKHRIPYILQPVGNLPRLGRSRAKKFLHDIVLGRWILNHAHRVVGASALEAETFSQFDIPPEKRAVVPNGIDLREFQSLPSSGYLRRRFHIPEDVPIVLFLGRIARIKSVDLAVSALDRLSCSEAHLVIVGPESEPDYAAALRSLALELGIDNRVTFTGPLSGNDKLAALVDADVFVLPSVFEIFGLAAAEAMAAGVPVIVTEGCGLAEQIAGRGGIVISHDLEELVTALNQLLADTSFRERLARGARRVAWEELTWEQSLSTLEALLAEIVGEELALSRTGGQ